MNPLAFQREEALSRHVPMAQEIVISTPQFFLPIKARVGPYDRKALKLFNRVLYNLLDRSIHASLLPPILDDLGDEEDDEPKDDNPCFYKGSIVYRPAVYQPFFSESTSLYPPTWIDPKFTLPEQSFKMGRLLEASHKRREKKALAQLFKRKRKGKSKKKSKYS